MNPIAAIEINFLDSAPVRLSLTERSYCIGRGSQCHIRFSDDPEKFAIEKLRLPHDRYLSACHCTLILIWGEAHPYYRVKDGTFGQYIGGNKITDGRLSTNGVFVNGVRLSLNTGYRHSLKHGDFVKLSPLTSFMYLDQKEEQEKQKVASGETPTQTN